MKFFSFSRVWMVLFLAPCVLGARFSTAQAANSRDAAPLSNPDLRGQLVLKSMPYSPAMKRKVTTWIYLPPGYDDAKNASRRYPTLYLLHGQPGGWTDCYRSGHLDTMTDTLITSGELQPVILVAFDGNGPGGVKDLTDFCNRQDGIATENFITSELVPYVDTNYRTLAAPEKRALWGYSAGGYGALNLGFQHPDIWRVLCCHAGFYSPGDDEEVMLNVLGPRGPRWNQNDPTQLVKTLPKGLKLHVYMDASPKEEGFDEFQEVQSQLKARGDDLQTQVLTKAHAWKLIVNRCRDSLLFAGQAFGRIDD